MPYLCYKVTRVPYWYWFRVPKRSANTMPYVLLLPVVHIHRRLLSIRLFMLCHTLHYYYLFVIFCIFLFLYTHEWLIMYIWFYLCMYVCLCYCIFIYSAFHGCKFVSTNSVQFSSVQLHVLLLLLPLSSTSWTWNQLAPCLLSDFGRLPLWLCIVYCVACLAMLSHTFVLKYICLCFYCSDAKWIRPELVPETVQQARAKYAFWKTSNVDGIFHCSPFCWPRWIPDRRLHWEKPWHYSWRTH